MNYKPVDFKLLLDTAVLVIHNFAELINYEENETLLSTHMLSNEFPILQN